MSSDRRARLQAREAELIAALYGGPAAHGLDGQMVTVAGEALVRKRARAVAKIFPALARGTEPEFFERFAAFARSTPPPDGGALADGLAFGQVMDRARCLTGEARLERKLATAQMKLRRHRLVPRRGPYLAATVAGPPGRLVLIIRLPAVGVHTFTLGPLTAKQRYM